MKKPFGLVLGAAALAALAMAGAFGRTTSRLAVSADGFTLATSPYRFAFPRDHAAHPAYQSEWWYYTGHLQTASGRRFGYELTFFRIGMRPGDPRTSRTQSRWRGNELYPAHFALTDERDGTFFHAERFAREALGMGAASTTSLDVKADRWTLNGAPLRRRDLERMRLRASAVGRAGTDAIDLVQLPLKPPAIHGSGGVSQKGPCRGCASHYYSYTRLRTNGTLILGGVRFSVDGESWMDHEFGSDQLQPDQSGWDWVSIQLRDGRELMLYRLRRKDGGITPESSGSLIARDGSVRHLTLDDFRLIATGSWKSPHTGATYPSGWRVEVPRANIAVVLIPTVRDQELAATPGGVSYWEGSVDVDDEQGGASRGVGYVELTGYAGGVSL